MARCFVIQGFGKKTDFTDGRVNGPAFVLGWIVGLAIVGAIVRAVASGADASDDGEPATWASVLKPILGVLLLLVLGVKLIGDGIAGL